ncbi:MAG: AAA family ATPase [Myxococcota bacterium]
MTTLDQTTRDYVRNLVVGTRLGRDLRDALRSPRALKRFPGGEPGYLDALRLLAPAGDTLGDAPWLHAVSRRVARWGGRPAPRVRVPPLLRRNLRLIAREFRLDPLEAALLQLCCVLSIEPSMQELGTLYFDKLDLSAATRVAASATASDPRQVAQRLKPDSTLRSTGLIETLPGLTDLTDKLKVSERVADLVLREDLDPHTLRECFVPLAPERHLTLADYSHMAEPVGIALRTLEQALARRLRGVNLLFYGEPGTGKSELAPLLAHRLRARLHTVPGEEPGGQREDPAQQRLRALARAQRVLAARPRTLLLFDEIDDLFGGAMGMLRGDGNRALSKRTMSTLLERNATPTIWTTNHAWTLEPAFQRRFQYTIRFDLPRAQARRELWQRITRGRIDPETTDLDALAERYPASPALIESATRTAALLAPDRLPTQTEIENVLRPSLELVTGRRLPRSRPTPRNRYRLEVLNTDVDLAELVAQIRTLARPLKRGLSLCLHGPPGTGKTEFAHYLARQTGRSVVAKAASEILNMYVGGTEQNLAGAFDEAERDDALLLFDEADSFLRDRAQARNSWEATMVNEFLRRLDDSRGLVVCTTNRVDDLDPAALRRFVFRVEFRWLRAEQARVLFEDLCEEVGALGEQAGGEVIERLSRMKVLAPADFSAVGRQVRALGRRPTRGEIVAAIRGQVAMRRRGSERIGFRCCQPSSQSSR